MTPLPVGNIFTNESAVRSFRNGRLNSENYDQSNNSIQLKVIFVNELDDPLTLCWVNGNGIFYHYYKLEPTSHNPLITSFIDEGKGVQITKKKTNCHVENTSIGHCFVLLEEGIEVEADEVKHEKTKKKEMKLSENIVAAYRPTKLTSIKEITRKEGVITKHVHIVTIRKKRKRRINPCFDGLFCGIPKSLEVELDVKESLLELDLEPIDTSDKPYEEIYIAGWKCMCEKSLFEFTNNEDEEEKDEEDIIGEDKKDNRDYIELIKKVRRQIEVDLDACSQKLPSQACEFLQKNIPIWINKSQKYGPKSAPIKGKGMCFHPGEAWLKENGMSPKKRGGVEMFEAGKYLYDHDLWYGKGGVMLHELSHAWHSEFVEDGYDNNLIKECYDAAMKEKLYEKVRVHNLSGGYDEKKAYAATNAMEYFAELSVAFLGGVDSDEDLEYNKWYPFNRTQIKEHDHRAYEMLGKIWNVE